jgi:hypothetical protein
MHEAKNKRRPAANPPHVRVVVRQASPAERDCREKAIKALLRAWAAAMVMAATDRMGEEL